MLLNGIYDVVFGSSAALGRAELALRDGHVAGSSDRGSRISGTYRFDAARGLAIFDLIAHMPPGMVAVTGRVCGPDGEDLEFTGECKPALPSNRFSVSFGGRAIDVAMTYVRPLGD